MELVNKMVELQEDRRKIIRKEITGDITVSFDGKEIGKVQSASIEQSSINNRMHYPYSTIRFPRGSGKTDFQMAIVEQLFRDEAHQQTQMNMIEEMLRDEMHRQAVILDNHSTLEFIDGDDMNGNRDDRPVFNDPIEQA